MAKWNEHPDARPPFEARLRVPDDTYQLRSHREALAMETEIRAQLDSRMADALADLALDKLSRRLGIPPGDLNAFFEFLWEDPELRERYIASVAARRIIGEPFYK